jgi:hypothetical protein
MWIVLFIVAALIVVSRLRGTDAPTGLAPHETETGRGTSTAPILPPPTVNTTNSLATAAFTHRFRKLS